MKSSTTVNTFAAGYQNEDTAGICIPAGLTLGMFIGLVIGELVFASLGTGMLVGAATGTMIGAALMAMCLKKKDIRR